MFIIGKGLIFLIKYRSKLFSVAGEIVHLPLKKLTPVCKQRNARVESNHLLSFQDPAINLFSTVSNT